MLGLVDFAIDRQTAKRTDPKLNEVFGLFYEGRPQYHICGKLRRDTYINEKWQVCVFLPVQ